MLCDEEDERAGGWGMAATAAELGGFTSDSLAVLSLGAAAAAAALT